MKTEEEEEEKEVFYPCLSVFLFPTTHNAQLTSPILLLRTYYTARAIPLFLSKFASQPRKQIV